MLILTLIVLLVVAAALTGCRPEETPAPTPPPQTPPAGEEEARYEDGTYDAELEPDQRGWKSTVEVTVANGEITEVNYDEVDEDGNLKSEDEEYNERWREASGIAAPEAYEDLEAQLIATQDIEEVEVVTGATSSTNSFKEVVAKALGEE